MELIGSKYEQFVPLRLMRVMVNVEIAVQAVRDIDHVSKKSYRLNTMGSVSNDPLQTHYIGFKNKVHLQMNPLNLSEND